jgi:hypothetical protein
LCRTRVPKCARALGVRCLLNGGKDLFHGRCVPCSETRRMSRLPLPLVLLVCACTVRDPVEGSPRPGPIAPEAAQDVEQVPASGVLPSGAPAANDDPAPSQIDAPDALRQRLGLRFGMGTATSASRTVMADQFRRTWWRDFRSKISAVPPSSPSRRVTPCEGCRCRPPSSGSMPSVR